MIKAKLDDDGYIDITITGSEKNIVKEMCAILDKLAENEETEIIALVALSDHLKHLKTE